MAFPNRDEILKIMEKIEKGKIKTTKALGRDASPIDQVKFNVCQKIIKFKRDQDLKSKDIATIIGVGPAVASRILHCEISKFKLDSLLDYYLRLVASLNNKKLINKVNKEIASFLSDVA